MTFKITTEEEMKQSLREHDQVLEGIFKGTIKVPANDIEAAKAHHAKYGDIDLETGTCLLSECALHYPETTPLPKEENSHIPGRIRQLINNL